jgi:hypothetical protein
LAVDLTLIAFSLSWLASAAPGRRKWGKRFSGLRTFPQNHCDALAGRSPTERRRATARSADLDFALLVEEHFLDFLAREAVPFDADVPVVAIAIVLVVPDDDDVVHGGTPKTIPHWQFPCYCRLI